MTVLKEKVHPRNKLNDLTAPEWITRTVSVFTQKGLGKSSDEAYYEKQHPAPFSFTDVSRFIEFFTKKGGRVLDPFGGIGSSAKAATLLERESVSIELNPFFAKLAKERLKKETPKSLSKLYKVINGDVRKAFKKLDSEYFDLILTSPPYWGILEKIDHKAKQERLDNNVLHNYGDLKADLSKITDYAEFVEVLSGIFTDLSVSIKPGGHAVIIIGDFRHKSKYYMFHADLAGALEKQGVWCLKGIKVMYQKHKRVFPYGYPYAYVPNIHHQYALILQKKKKL